MKQIYWVLAIAILAIGIASLRQSNSHSIFLTRSRETRRADAYHVVAYRNHKFIIEHRDQRLTVKCEQAVTWLDGPDKDPLPFADRGQCVYIEVGEYIGEDLMDEDQIAHKLTYYPWRGEDTVQTADFMTITDEDEIH